MINADLGLTDEPSSPSITQAGISSDIASSMIIVLGTATVYSEIGCALVGHLMDVVYGGHRRLHCVTLGQLRDLWGEQKEVPILITSDCPDTALAYLLTTSNFPLLAFFDDPIAALAYPTVIEGQPLHSSIRFATRRFSCLTGCVGSPRIKIFGSESLTLGLPAMVDAIFAAVGCEPGEMAARVVRRFANSEGVEAGVSIEETVRRRMNGKTLIGAAERFDVVSQRLIAWFSSDYGPLLRGEVYEAIEWPLELFYTGWNGETGDRNVDLVGGARHIYWGPDLHLPLGNWRAHLQFEVSDNFSGNEIEADVCISATAAQVTRRQINLPEQGYFQFSFDFANIDPNAALQIRVWLNKGAIEGRFGLRRVTLTPLNEAGKHLAHPLRVSSDS